MALSYPTGNSTDKSEAIRQHLAINPEASPEEVLAALARQGVAASPDRVQELREEIAIESGEREEADERRTTTRPTPAAASHELRDKVEVDDLAAARDFVAQLGNIERAREALDRWQRLQDSSAKPH